MSAFYEQRLRQKFYGNHWKSIQVEWVDGSTRRVEILLLNPHTIRLLAASPLDPKSMRELVRTLKKDYGAKNHDLVGVGGEAMPAVQEFDVKTGHRTIAIHFQMDKFQDPPNGEAALQRFDPVTGRKVGEERFQQNKREDAMDGDVAGKCYDPLTGELIRAWSYKDNFCKREWTKEQLKTERPMTHKEPVDPPEALPPWLKPFEKRLKLL